MSWNWIFFDRLYKLYKGCIIYTRKKLFYTAQQLHIWCVMENELLFMMAKAVQRLVEISEEMVMEQRKITGIVASLQHSNDGDEELDIEGVKQYLGISRSTVYRSIDEGILKPRKLPGGNRFYKRDLEEARKESVRRGRL
jgi:predicted DNA-binding transcriptional regulator AlpA